MGTQNRAQKYAEAALAKVERVSAELAREYRARAENLPVMVLQSGLVQAVGFLRAKAAGDGERAAPYRQYVEDLAQLVSGKHADAFHRDIIGASAADYRRLTRETLLAAGWLKRFAQVHLKDKPKSIS